MSDAAAAVVDPVERSTSRPRSSKAALDYLALSGATPISIRPTDAGGSKIRFGKVDPNAAIVVWCEETRARPVIRLARRYAGPGASVTAASAALRKAASDLRVVLTPDTTAMERAAASVVRLEEYFESMRQSGQLQQFNKIYKLRRAEATAMGQSFMTFSAASRKLKVALVPLLVGGDRPAPGKLFAEIFGR